MARVSPGPRRFQSAGNRTKSRMSSTHDSGMDALTQMCSEKDVLRKLANRAQVYKNFEGGQRLTVGGINDPMASFMPSAFSK